MIDPEDAELLNALKRADPELVRTYAPGEDEPNSEIAVPTRRRKWASVMEAIASVGRWSRLTFHNKKGQLLGGYERGEAGQPEELTAPATVRAGETRAMLELMLKGQERALAYRDKEIGQVLQAIPEVLRMMTHAMQSMTGMYQAQVAAAADIAAANAADGDVLSQITELVKTAPALMPVLAPFMRGLLPKPPAPQPPPRPPNGHTGS